MPTIDEIPAAMPEPTAEGDHEYLTIDPVTRTITVPEAEKIIGVTGDELADRKYFMCPRYVGDGLDLAAMFIRVNYRNANGEEDGYLVNDVAVSGDYVTFSWQLWPKVAAYKGEVLFGVCADLPNTPDRKMPDWNTTMATGEVLEGLHPDLGDVEAETSDVVTQLRAETAAQTAAVEACGAAQVDVVEAASAAATADAQAQIEAKGAATLATIPADYATLAATVDRLTRDRAAAIVCEVAGAAIQVQDASNDPLQGLRIFGRSTQDGTPTPEAPVEIVSTPAPVVTVCGKNLVVFSTATLTESGITAKKTDDGGVLINGTATAAVCFCFDFYNRIYCQGMSLIASLENATPGVEMIVGYIKEDTTFVENLAKVAAAEVPFTYPAEAYKTRSYILVERGTTCNNLIVYPMVRPAAAGSTFEPYTGQTLTITTPGSLPGIPVASGGNYTDAAGQQWIADEVDLARGVYVQRVLTFTPETMSSVASGAKNNRAHVKLPQNGLTYSARATGLCSHFAFNTSVYSDTGDEVGFIISSETVFFRFTSESDITTTELGQAWLDEQAANGKPFTVTYILAEPMETPLSDVELQAFRALHSNKPTTTVLNDAGAWMALEYAADPKTYIDNKLAALVAAKN